MDGRKGRTGSLLHPLHDLPHARANALLHIRFEEVEAIALQLGWRAE